MNMKNEILEEIWKARQKVEESENGDLQKVFKKMQEETSNSTRKRFKGTIKLKAQDSQGA